MKARLVKGEFWQDERVAQVGHLERCFLAGLLHLADRDGRLEDRPLKLRALALPYDAADGDALLTALAAAGLVRRFGGVIQIVAWSTWVAPFANEAKSVIPEPMECSTPVEQGSRPVASPKLPGSLVQATVKVIDKEEVIEKEKKPRKRAPAPGEGSDLLEAAFSHHPPRKSQDGRPLPKGTRVAALPRLLEVARKYGLTLADITDIVDEYHHHPLVAEGYVQAVEVFWGSERGRWLDCWGVVQRTRRKAQERSDA